ncbi:flavin reductase family protein [Nonomuraea sp. NPDC023979]|uniref:flavin reductase family protein n=1 Tax=Nonomuraea sp. NPDC023979 TaxID=3154796 RepID=UPI0033C3526D
MTPHAARPIAPSRHPGLAIPRPRRTPAAATPPAPAVPTAPAVPVVPAPRPDSARFRSVLGRFATGVVAITALDPVDGSPCGLAANSFTSVSLDPPLVGFCVAHTSTSWPRLRATRAVTVNVLAEHQRAACAQLASRGGDKFAGLGWTPSPAGNPVLDGALAWLDCSIEAEHRAGDHMIVVARVHRFDTLGDGGPLLFFRGGYGAFTSAR